MVTPAVMPVPRNPTPTTRMMIGASPDGRAATGAMSSTGAKSVLDVWCEPFDSCEANQLAAVYSVLYASL